MVNDFYSAENFTWDYYFREKMMEQLQTEEWYIRRRRIQRKIDTYNQYLSIMFKIIGHVLKHIINMMVLYYWTLTILYGLSCENLVSKKYVLTFEDAIMRDMFTGLRLYILMYRVLSRYFS